MSGPLSVPFAIAAFLVKNQTAQVLLGLTAFVCVWAAAYWVWKPERQALIERDQVKRQLLDEISDLRNQMVTLRIDMERDVSEKKFNEKHWTNKLKELQQLITTKIEQFSSKAEANMYSKRGNISRPINPVMGSYSNPLHLDICIYDLDYLKEFIRDYSRNRNRN